MPNWCNNSFRIEGPKEKISAIWEKISNTQEECFLQTICPLVTDPCRDTVINNWGTKWEVSAEGMEYEETGDTAVIYGWFESAWAPPVSAFEQYFAANDDVTGWLKYFEPGQSFIGEWDRDNGDECYEIDGDNLDALPQDLREHFDVDSWFDKEE